LGPVKVRKGKNRHPHFYHTAAAPSCRLYSKSEDHLLVQLQLQKILPMGEAKMEKPILSINRVADVVWEKQDIVFEIQCSILFEPQAAARIREYKKAGYHVVWILDDRLYNKRNLRPAEAFLRQMPCYFANVGRSQPTVFYDQHEILIGSRRVKKGRALPVDLPEIRNLTEPRWPENLPRHIEQRIPYLIRYFKGDLIDRALHAYRTPFLAQSLEYWKRVEGECDRKARGDGWMVAFFRRFIRDPYLAFLNALIQRMN
jgi:hypothetical protein